MVGSDGCGGLCSCAIKGRCVGVVMTGGGVSSGSSGKPLSGSCGIGGRGCL